MDTRTLSRSRTALVLAGLALAAASCGSDDTPSSSGAGAGAATTGGGIVSISSVDGTTVLASADGHTLYDATAESAEKILCVEGCTTFWKPLMASRQQAQQASTALHQGFAVVDRPEGGTQLAYAGHPLYTFTREGAHQLSGDGFEDDFQGTHFEWRAATTGGSTGASPSTGGGDGGGFGY